MFKDIDDKPIEPPRKKAERKWRNNDLSRRFKAAQKKADETPKGPKELQIADTIGSGKPDRRGTIIRAQTKFAKELKMMMEGHAERNRVFYFAFLQDRKRRLLVEKLRRLSIS